MPSVSKVSAWAMQMTHVRAARTFIEACEATGIAVLPVKGIVSGRTLYDDPAERPLTDVDVRVVPRDVRRVVALCRRNGWPIVQYMRSVSNAVAIVDDVAIDVEAHVGPPGVCDLTIEHALAHATWSTALGFRCRWPDFTDHGVMLVMNAFKDKMVGGFEWAIHDLERLPHRVDPRALARALVDAGISTIGWIVADWMVTVRKATVWANVRGALGDQSPRLRYVRVMSAAIARKPAAFFTRVLSRVGSDHVGNRIRSLAYLVAWQAEALATARSKHPFRRGHARPWDPYVRYGNQ